MCKISVLIPAYNVEPYIRQCLDSVLSQTLNDLEVICVDDASTDGTLGILKEYEAADPRVRVFRHETNRGQSCGRNLALSHAKGEYVYMLDADDMIVPEALEELYRVCADGRLDAAGFETFPFADDPDFQKAAALKTIRYQDGPVMNGREAICYCMDTETFSLSVPTFMMRRAYLEQIGLRFTEGILHEDVGYLFELIVRARRLRFLHKVYFLRRIRARSTMTSAFTSANIEGYLKSFSRSFDLEPVLKELWGDDPAFWTAVGKWRRDIYGRLRQLYLQSEQTIYRQDGGHVDEETRRMFEILKLSAAGRERAKAILGKDVCARLEQASGRAEATPEEDACAKPEQASSDRSGPPAEVYICGNGQYAERLIDLLGALDVVIRGILVTEPFRRTFRGFPVRVLGDETSDGGACRDTRVPVVMGVSHYKREEYEQALTAAGYGTIIRVPF